MIRIRRVRAEDAPAVAAIYAPYVDRTPITFEEIAPDAAEMTRRIADTHAPYPWLVAEAGDGAIAGYAYARAFHTRPAYRWTCETTIYLAEARRGGGMGGLLYATLLDRLEAAGFASAMALVTVPNDESTRFHERLGFREAGRLRGVGFKHGRWHDVSYWQRDLAQRSDVPGEPWTMAGEE